MSCRVMTLHSFARTNRFKAATIFCNSGCPVANKQREQIADENLTTRAERIKNCPRNGPSDDNASEL